MDNTPTNEALSLRIKELEEEVDNLKKKQIPLLKSEEKWRRLVDNAPNIITITDRNGIVQYVNHTVPGLSVNELIGRHIKEFEHPEFHHISRDVIHDVFQYGKTGSYQLKGMGTGSGISWYEVYYGPVLEDGNVNGVIFVLTDITEHKETEEALRENENRFRTQYRKTPAMLHSTNYDGTILSVSDYWLDALGYERSEVIGRKVTDFLTEDSRSYADEVVIPAYLKTGFCEDVPYQFVKKNGIIIDVLLSAISQKDEKGDIIQSIAVLNNVTEQKQVEEALLISNERYKALFERSLDAVFINDFNGNFLDANPASLNLTGYTKSEIHSINLATLLTESQIPSAFEVIDEIVKTGSQKELVEFKLKRKDGSFIWVETKGSLIYKNGSPFAVQGIARDITARKQAEMSLKESEEKFRLISDQSLMAIAVIQDGLIKYANRKYTQLTEYTHEEIYNWKPYEYSKVVYSEDRNFVMEQAQRKQTASKDVVTHYTFRGLSKSGRIIWCEIYSKTVQFNGKPADLITLIDISKSKIAETELKESKERYRLLAETKKL